MLSCTADFPPLESTARADQAGILASSQRDCPGDLGSVCPSKAHIDRGRDASSSSGSDSSQTSQALRESRARPSQTRLQKRALQKTRRFVGDAAPPQRRSDESCSEEVWTVFAARTDEKKTEAIDAGPVRLSLAQILDGKEAPPAPWGNDSEDTSNRNASGSGVLALALADELPFAAPSSSLTADAAIPAISLQAAVFPAEPVSFAASLDFYKAEPFPASMGLMRQCQWPHRLCLAEHLMNENPIDVKEDFLATPLPFVGVVR